MLQYQLMSITVGVNGTVQCTSFLFMNEIEHYYCHELWFTYCNNCNLIFSSLKLENGLKKHYGFVELVVIQGHILIGFSENKFWVGYSGSLRDNVNSKLFRVGGNGWMWAVFNEIWVEVIWF